MRPLQASAVRSIRPGPDLRSRRGEPPPQAVGDPAGVPPCWLRSLVCPQVEGFFLVFSCLSGGFRFGIMGLRGRNLTFPESALTFSSNPDICRPLSTGMTPIAPVRNWL